MNDLVDRQTDLYDSRVMLLLNSAVVSHTWTIITNLRANLYCELHLVMQFCICYASPTSDVRVRSRIRSALPVFIHACRESRFAGNYLVPSWCFLWRV